MMRRFLRSRGARKFFGSKLATASLVVIVLYIVIAIVVGAGAITKEETLWRVGPDRTPGLGAEQDFEKQLLDAQFHIERVERTLDRNNVEEALDDLALAERRIADKTPEELAEVVERAWTIYDEIAETKDVAEMDAFDAAEEALTAVGELSTKDILAEAGLAADAVVAELVASEAFRDRLTELNTTVDEFYAPLEGLDASLFAFRLYAGTDEQGRSISIRAVYSIKVALQVGMIVALAAVVFGSLLGAAAAFYGGWVDALVIWLYSTLSSIPHLVMLMMIAYAFIESPYEDTLIPVYAALSLTFWISPCRVVRGETLKIKELEYVQAATAVGFGRLYILLRHVIPNTAHLMFINFSLLFIGAVKSEVILSFLGLGVKNQPSWGIMIRDSRPDVLNNFFYQIGAATLLMFVLVMAFNILSDALQDAFDPKHVS